MNTSRSKNVKKGQKKLNAKMYLEVDEYFEKSILDFAKMSFVLDVAKYLVLIDAKEHKKYQL